jgi:hypothetical protein
MKTARTITLDLIKLLYLLLGARTLFVRSDARTCRHETLRSITPLFVAADKNVRAGESASPDQLRVKTSLFKATPEGEVSPWGITHIRKSN